MEGEATRTEVLVGSLIAGIVQFGLAIIVFGGNAERVELFMTVGSTGIGLMALGSTQRCPVAALVTTIISCMRACARFAVLSLTVDNRVEIHTVISPLADLGLFRRTEEFHFFAVHNYDLPQTKRFVEPDRGGVFASVIARSRANAHHDSARCC